MGVFYFWWVRRGFGFFGVIMLIKKLCLGYNGGVVVFGGGGYVWELYLLWII
jgi:hypothetical protein